MCSIRQAQVAVSRMDLSWFPKVLPKGILPSQEKEATLARSLVRLLPLTTLRSPHPLPPTEDFVSWRCYTILLVCRKFNFQEIFVFRSPALCVAGPPKFSSPRCASRLHPFARPSWPPQTLSALDIHDHKQMTVLMHAVAKGPAPMFEEVHRALRRALGGDDIVSLDVYGIRPFFFAHNNRTRRLRL